MGAWESFTAPLPSPQTFTDGNTDGAADYDLESGNYSASAEGVSTPDMFDITSPYHREDEAEPPAGSALFKKINGGIYNVADKLSRTFYDQVTKPEEELLLPVHNDERETPSMPGVVVE